MNCFSEAVLTAVNIRWFENISELSYDVAELCTSCIVVVSMFCLCDLNVKVNHELM